MQGDERVKLDLTAEGVNAWRASLPSQVQAVLAPVAGDDDVHAQAAIRLGEALSRDGLARGMAEALTEGRRAGPLVTLLLGMEQTRRIRLLCWCAGSDLRSLKRAATADGAKFPPPLLFAWFSGWLGGDRHVAAVVQRDLGALAAAMAQLNGVDDPQNLEIWKVANAEPV